MTEWGVEHESIRSRRLRVGGVATWLRETGPERASEAVLLLHGNPGSGADFDDLLPRIGRFARAIAPDMPGFGLAERPRDFDYSVAGYARHIAAMLGELGVRRVHLVLHDFGGPWGLHWAVAHSQQVASVVLFNVGFLPGFRWHPVARLWRTPILGELAQLVATRRLVIAAVKRGNPMPFPKGFLERFYEHVDWPMKRAVLTLYRVTDNFEELAKRGREVLAPLSLPALVIWGEQDSYVPVRFAAQQQAYFAAEVHILADTGHWPMADQAERVGGLVLPFLRRQLAKPSGH